MWNGYSIKKKVSFDCQASQIWFSINRNVETTLEATEYSNNDVRMYECTTLIF